MNKITDAQKLIEKVAKITKEKKLDLSSDEDLSIGIMNLISIEEHLYFTSQKTNKDEYLDLLNEVRGIRTELLGLIIKDYEGEVWCISKHLLASSMRLIEVGTKELKKGNKDQAKNLFEKSYKLYSLFWGINLNIINVGDTKNIENEAAFINDVDGKKTGYSLMDRLGVIVKKAVDCCKE